MASTLHHGSHASSTDQIASSRDHQGPKIRCDSPRRRRQSSVMLPTPDADGDFYSGSSRRRVRNAVQVGSNANLNDSSDEEIAITSSGKAVTPFLADHIPQTYNPMAGLSPSSADNATSSTTQYCNRHRPDRKCRRQADGPSMEQLQSKLGSLSQTDQQSISHVWSIFSAAPAKQRNLLLQGILSACCYPQLSFVATSVRDLIKLDFVALLPNELSYKILCYLDTASLCKAARVSQQWRQLADDDVVWHKMCEQHIDKKCIKCGWGLPSLERKRLRMEKRQIQLRATGRGLNQWSPDITPLPESRSIGRDVALGKKRQLSTSLPPDGDAVKRLCTRPVSARQPWKDVYKARFKVGTNWKHGRYSLKVLKGHNDGVTCLQFNDNILATGSYDSKIKIWDIASGKEIRTLSGHTAPVRCLQMSDTQLISGGLDNTVRVWDWTTGKLIKELKEPKDGVLGVHFDSNYLVAGSMDGDVYVWNTLTREKYKLRGHTDFVNSVKLDIPSRTAVSASDDCTVRLWDLETRKVLRTFYGHVGPVQQVLFLPHDFDCDDTDFADHGHDNDTETDTDHADHDRDPHHVDTEGASHVPPLQTPPISDPRRTSATPPPPLTNPPLFPDDSSRPNPPQYMLTCALDATLRLWHVPSGRCLRTFFGHLEGIWALAADSLRVVSGAQDKTIKVWDPKTGVCERTFIGHNGPVNCVGLGLSGDVLVSGGADGHIRVLEFASELCNEDGG